MANTNPERLRSSYGLLPEQGATSLTAEDTGTVDSTYGQAEADVINNLRTRLGELETVLTEAGFLK